MNNLCSKMRFFRYLLLIFLGNISIVIQSQDTQKSLVDNCGIKLIVDNDADTDMLKRDASISKGFHFSIENTSENEVEIRIAVVNLDFNALEYKKHRIKTSVNLLSKIVLYGLNENLIIERNDEKSYLLLKIPADVKLDFFVSQNVSEIINQETINFSKIQINSVNCKSLLIESILQTEFSF
jgi:hypothetical protein